MALLFWAGGRNWLLGSYWHNVGMRAFSSLVQSKSDALSALQKSNQFNDNWLVNARQSAINLSLGDDYAAAELRSQVMSQLGVSGTDFCKISVTDRISAYAALFRLNGKNFSKDSLDTNNRWQVLVSRDGGSWRAIDVSDNDVDISYSMNGSSCLVNVYIAFENPDDFLIMRRTWGVRASVSYLLGIKYSTDIFMNRFGLNDRFRSAVDLTDKNEFKDYELMFSTGLHQNTEQVLLTFRGKGFVAISETKLELLRED